jgi:hypothetical protein
LKIGGRGCVLRSVITVDDGGLHSAKL